MSGRFWGSRRTGAGTLGFSSDSSIFSGRQEARSSAGVEVRTPLSSYSTAAPHTVFEKRVCVRLCSVCSFVSKQAPYKVASGMGTLGGWRLAPGLQDGRGWSVFTLWRPGEGAWGRRWERARRERGAVHPHIQGGAPLLPPAPGRFHPGVCWGDRWGDWGETRQAPRTG